MNRDGGQRTTSQGGGGYEEENEGRERRRWSGTVVLSGIRGEHSIRWTAEWYTSRDTWAPEEAIADTRDVLEGGG
jgi:hypothetical protein